VFLSLTGALAFWRRPLGCPRSAPAGTLTPSAASPNSIAALIFIGWDAAPTTPSPGFWHGLDGSRKWKYSRKHAASADSDGSSISQVDFTAARLIGTVAGWQCRRLPGGGCATGQTSHGALISSPPEATDLGGCARSAVTVNAGSWQRLLRYIRIITRDTRGDHHARHIQPQKVWVERGRRGSRLATTLNEMAQSTTGTFKLQHRFQETEGTLMTEIDTTINYYKERLQSDTG
jgi:hypothetical protein